MGKSVAPNECRREDRWSIAPAVVARRCRLCVHALVTPVPPSADAAIARAVRNASLAVSCKYILSCCANYILSRTLRQNFIFLRGDVSVERTCKALCSKKCMGVSYGSV